MIFFNNSQKVCLLFEPTMEMIENFAHYVPRTLNHTISGGTSMLLADAEKARLIDYNSIEKYKIPSALLMENAGMRVADVAMEDIMRLADEIIQEIMK